MTTRWLTIPLGSIYVTRTIISAYFNFRIESLNARLKRDQEERAKTIQKLKDATKYDSTMELIEKYGGAENKAKAKKKDKTSSDGTDIKSSAATSSPTSKGGVPARTNLPPPPTANIVRSSPRPSLGNQPDEHSMRQNTSPVGVDNVQSGAEFAPNAFTHPSANTLPPSARGQNEYMASEHHWYDRLFDVLLGEDETAAKNRIVLICQNCRRVNGQAPPGTKSLAELGLWKCMACSAVNGEKDEGERIVQEVLAGSSSKDTDRDESIVSAAEEVSEEDGHDEDTQAGSDGDASDVKTTGAEGPAGSVKARRRTGK